VPCRLYIWMIKSTINLQLYGPGHADEVSADEIYKNNEQLIYIAIYLTAMNEILPGKTRKNRKFQLFHREKKIRSKRTLILYLFVDKL